MYIVTTSKYHKHTQQNREDKRERVRAVKRESQEKKEERVRKRREKPFINKTNY